jgi:hypothetical protein
MQRAIDIRGLSKGQVPERDVRGITTGGLYPGTVSAKNDTPRRTGLRVSRAGCPWTNGEVRLGGQTPPMSLLGSKADFDMPRMDVR